VLLTAGPWRPVTLHTYHAHISNLHVSARVDEYLEADLTVRIVLSSLEAPCTAEVLLKDPSGDGVTGQSKITMKDGVVQVTFQFKKGNISLWYPVGYGEQPLYDVHVKVFDVVRPNSIKGRNRVFTAGHDGSKATYWIPKFKRLGFVACVSWRKSWLTNPDSPGSSK
jgi:hypothetical protein